MPIVRAVGISWIQYPIYCITTPAIAFFTRFVYRPLHEEIEQFYPKGFRFLGAIGFLGFCITWFVRIHVNITKSSLLLYYIVIATTSSMMMAFYAGLTPLIKNYKQQMLDTHDRELFQSQLGAIKMNNASIEANEYKTKIIRHDLRHYAANIDTLIVAGEYAKARIELSRFSNSLNAVSEKIYCANLLINGVLSNYISLAEKNGTKTTINIKSTLPGKNDDAEFAVFLANILENAVNASLLISKDDRTLNILFVQTGDNLCIEVSNHFNGQLLQSVADLNDVDTVHGIGAHSIQRFAKRNNIILDYEIVKIYDGLSDFILRADINAKKE